MIVEKIEGERVLLRPWKLSNVKELQKLANDESIAKYTTVPFPYGEKDALEFIGRAEPNLKENVEHCFAIVDRENNVIIGSTSILKIDSRNKKAEIGYWLGKDFRKQGFMQEALQLLLDYGFEKLGLNRIGISCATGNKDSRKVIEKAGGKFEGIEREGNISGLGQAYDLRNYSILKKEFK